MGSWGREDLWQGGWNTQQVRWQQVVLHLCADKLKGTTGEQDRLSNPEFQCGKIKPQKPLTKKSVGVEAAGETPSLTREFVGGAHGVLECTQTHPPGVRTTRAQFACG